MTINPNNAILFSKKPQIGSDKNVENVLSKLKKLKGEHSIAVGLSGGVDSSLTAALLVKAGWKVEGLTLWLMSGKGSCCTDGLVDATGICEQLGIPHHVVDSRKKFQSEIVENLIKGYQQGITPSPCSICNRFVKFGPMLEWTEKNLGFTRIATGHYARINHAKKDAEYHYQGTGLVNRHQLLRGRDENKDQSYFLYDLSQEILGKVVFPLGELKKSETREEADRFNLRTAKKPESQDLCLAEHHGSMKAFLDNYIAPKKGEITLKSGEILGEHDGIEHFTIGQRKGLGISWEEPLHVIEIQANSNRVIVAPRSKATQTKCIVGAVNWVSIEPIIQKTQIEVQLRYRSKPVLATLIPIEPLEKDIQRNRPYRCHLSFKSEQFSITPGQAAVFYNGDLLLGGGIIETDET